MLRQNISSFCTLSTLSGTSTLSLFRRPWKLLSLKVWLLENGNRNSLPHPHTPKEQPPGWWTHRVSQTPAAFLLSETLPKHPVANILNYRLLKCIAFGYFKRILVFVVYTSLQRTGNPFLQKKKTVFWRGLHGRKHPVPIRGHSWFQLKFLSHKRCTRLTR